MRIDEQAHNACTNTNTTAARTEMMSGPCTSLSLGSCSERSSEQLEMVRPPRATSVRFPIPARLVTPLREIVNTARHMYPRVSNGWNQMCCQPVVLVAFTTRSLGSANCAVEIDEPEIVTAGQHTRA